MKKIILIIFITIISLFVASCNKNSYKIYLDFKEKRTDIQLNDEEKNDIYDYLKKVTTYEKSYEFYKYGILSVEEDTFEYEEYEKNIYPSYYKNPLINRKVYKQKHNEYDYYYIEKDQYINGYHEYYNNFKTIRENKTVYSTTQNKSEYIEKFYKNKVKPFNDWIGSFNFKASKSGIFKQNNIYYFKVYKNENEIYGYVIFEKGNYKEFSFKVKDYSYVMYLKIN